MKNILFFSFLQAVLLQSGDIMAQGNRNCRALPAFVYNIGFDATRSYLSTSEKKMMGLVCIEIPVKENDPPRSYQHPTWKNAGWLGPMLITEKGDVWVAPVPVINLLYNKPEDQNKLWKTESATGEMKVALELPKPDSVFNGQNPYGIVGLGYDCDNSTIYISSLAGSTYEQEVGHIYAVRAADLKIIGQIDSVDALGLDVGIVNGVKKMYFGRARSGRIQAVDLNGDGTFKGTPATELTLDNLGPRGDDRARKIRFGPDGTMQVQGSEFYYNLTAPTEKQETPYKFRYNAREKRWQIIY